MAFTFSVVNRSANSRTFVCSAVAGSPAGNAAGWAAVWPVTRICRRLSELRQVLQRNCRLSSALTASFMLPFRAPKRIHQEEQGQDEKGNIGRRRRLKMPCFYWQYGVSWQEFGDL